MPDTKTITANLTLDEARHLIGDRMPRITGAMPAAWWLTTDPEILDGIDEYDAAYKKWHDGVFALADELGVKKAMTGRFGLYGFIPTAEMRADRTLIPAGWRIDAKRDYLVLSRKRKADRESDAAKRFNEVCAAPQEYRFFTPMDLEVELPTDRRDGSFHRYSPAYRRVEHAVMAVIGADPDRVPGADSKVETTVWHRQKLSVLVALAEEHGDA
ncbi:hypothetical protein TPA4_59 [Tsukamurella phage TPA4]|uniref:hypothetical protein n=1 Tax=Tsukamurella phage TPA4 TaxID=1647476 RepID=UPI0007B6449D|nr:hypothetical protein BH784_gp59 [Tsukamurella phage TPA4]AKJ72224.1 hypothetical protein TPA4_59 [Tsukamurella phage TPA4]